MRDRLAAAALAWAFAFAMQTAAAGVPTLGECLEGSDFIANAARARDNGFARDAFLARMQADFIVIRAFPPALRWFARDDDDERFLLDAATRVFDRPRTPDGHRSEFLGECVARLAAT